MAGAASVTEDTEEVAAPAAETPPAKPRGKLGLIIGLVVALTAAGAGGYFFFAKKKASAAAAAETGQVEKSGGKANYLALTPSFTVNLDDEEASRYLQVEIEVMARNVSALDNVKLHTPRIRNALLLLFGQQKYHDLSTRAGKEALQVKVLAEIQNILKAETGETGIEAVYFTSFVMQ